MACGGSVARTDEDRLDATTKDDASATADGGGDIDLVDAAFTCSTTDGATVTDAAPSAYLGFSLTVAPGETEGGVGIFVGRFFASPAEWPDRTCCQVIGPCIACAASCDTGSVPSVSDGALQIAGPRFQAFSVQFDSDAGLYASSTLDPPAGTTGPVVEWSDTLCVSGGGGEAPAFPNLSVVVPGLFSLTSPMIPEGPDGSVATAHIATESDLVLTWAETDPDVTVIANLGYFSYPVLTCSFAGSTGTGTIPRAALAPFAGYAEVATFGVSARRSAAYAVGSYVLNVGATGGFEVYAIFE